MMCYIDAGVVYNNLNIRLTFLLLYSNYLMATIVVPVITSINKSTISSQLKQTN